MKIFVLFLHLVLFSPAIVLAADMESPPKGMILIKGGCFKMGTEKIFTYELGRENYRERPVHEVCVDDFYLDKYEVTQKKWTQSMKYHRPSFAGPELPVDHASFELAKSYCSHLGRRLPTEAEWEYAARAGSKALYPWGELIDSDYMWYQDNSFRKPHPPGQKKPNAWGLYDMIGNVWEWTSDWFSEHYYKESPRNNPKGPKIGSWHVIRGASWVDEEKDMRVTIRQPGDADPTDWFLVGVRCAKSSP